MADWRRMLHQALDWQGRLFLLENRVVVTEDSVVPLHRQASTQIHEETGDDFIRELEATGLRVKRTSFGFTTWKTMLPERIFAGPIYFDAVLGSLNSKNAVIGYYRLDNFSRSFFLFCVNSTILFIIASLISILLSIPYGDADVWSKNHPLEALVIPAFGVCFLFIGIRTTIYSIFAIHWRTKNRIVSALQSVIRSRL